MTRQIRSSSWSTSTNEDRGCAERRAAHVLVGNRIALNLWTHATIPDVPDLPQRSPRPTWNARARSAAGPSCSAADMSAWPSAGPGVRRLRGSTARFPQGARSARDGLPSRRWSWRPSAWPSSARGPDVFRGNRVVARLGSPCRVRGLAGEQGRVNGQWTVRSKLVRRRAALSPVAASRAEAGGSAQSEGRAPHPERVKGDGRGPIVRPSRTRLACGCKGARPSATGVVSYPLRGEGPRWLRNAGRGDWQSIASSPHPTTT
jgi:hypothetical protein